MLRIALIVIVAAVSTSTSNAQEQPAYCRSAAAALFLGSGEAEFVTVRQKCKRGDTIAISIAAQGSVFQVARLCDLTKSVVTLGQNVVCVLAGERGIR